VAVEVPAGLVVAHGGARVGVPGGDRMIKLRQKVSGCLRTLAGAEQFCAIRSYLATAAKHGIHFLESLVALAQGCPWLPETA
jgi:transposase